MHCRTSKTLLSVFYIVKSARTGLYEFASPTLVSPSPFFPSCIQLCRCKINLYSCISYVCIMLVAAGCCNRRIGLDHREPAQSSLFSRRRRRFAKVVEQFDKLFRSLGVNCNRGATTNLRKIRQRARARNPREREREREGREN
jgi:hypothetical protein